MKSAFDNALGGVLFTPSEEALQQLAPSISGKRVLEFAANCLHLNGHRNTFR